MKFGGKTVLVQHVPPTNQFEVPEFVDFVLCGHVHDAWKYSILADNRNTQMDIPLINVGTDMWGFKPVSIKQILAYYEKLI